MNMTLLRAIRKARHNGLLRLTPADKPISFLCLSSKCSKCCNNLGSPVLNPIEAESILLEMIEHIGPHCFMRSKNSICCALDEGYCTIHGVHPRGCKEYPWYNIGGKLYYDAGCPGIGHNGDDRPDIESIQPFENFLPDEPRWVIWLIKKICISKKYNK